MTTSLPTSVLPEPRGARHPTDAKSSPGNQDSLLSEENTGTDLTPLQGGPYPWVYEPPRPRRMSPPNSEKAVTPAESSSTPAVAAIAITEMPLPPRR